MIDGLTPTNLNEFRGLYSYGPPESCPKNFFQVADNLRYFPSGFETRWGTSLSTPTVNGVLRWYPFHLENQAPRIIYLDALGNLIDSLYPTTIILNITGMIDFSMVVFNDRAYLSPHNGSTGLSSEFVYIYQGNSTIRLAGGNAPTGMSFVATQTGTGKVEVGARFYAMVYETDSGFVTRPGPGTFGFLTSVAGTQVTITSDFTFPSGVVAAHIVATKATDITDQILPEYFFVPGATVLNPTDTTIVLDFYDDDLTDSADYLFDQLEVIPAVLGLTSYQNSLVGWGIPGQTSIVYISKAGEPESINAITGGIEVEKSFGGGVQNCVEYRGQLLMHKRTRVYSTINNGQEPVFWGTPLCIDKSVGTAIHGIATILDEEGNTTDKYIIADNRGLLAYDGTFNVNLTKNINDVWERINKKSFNKLQVVIDPTNEVIYVAAPMDTSTIAAVILYGDYSEGLDEENIKWSQWTFPYFPTCIGGDLDDFGDPTFRIGALNGNIFSLNENSTNDNDVAIPRPQFKTGFIGDENIAVTQYNAIRIRGTGAGILQLAVHGLGGPFVDQTSLVSLIIPENSARLLQREFTFHGQAMCLIGLVDNVDERFRITAISIYSAAMFLEEPS